MVDLRKAIRQAVAYSAKNAGTKLTNTELTEFAGFLANASQGLWSYGRSSVDDRELERFKNMLLKILTTRLNASSTL